MLIAVLFVPMVAVAQDGATDANDAYSGEAGAGGADPGEAGAGDLATEGVEVDARRLRPKDETTDGTEASDDTDTERDVASYVAPRVAAKTGQRVGIGSAGFGPMFDFGQGVILSTQMSLIEARERAYVAQLRDELTDFSRQAVEAARASSEVASNDAAQPDQSDQQPGEQVDEDESFFVRTRLIDPERLARTGGAAHRFGESDLEALEYDDPTAMLLQVPGVAIRKEDGFGLRPNIGIRGANAERSKKITLMEDGVLFAPAAYAAPAAYYFPIVSRMVGIEVFKGPSSVRFGPHTIGGAVNWVSRDIPGRTAGGFDVNAGSYLTGKAHGWFGSSNDWGGFLIEGVQWHSEGYKDLDGGGDTGFDKSELMAKGRLNTDPAKSTYHALELKLGYSRERSNETYLGLTDEDFRDDPYRRYRASALDEMEWWRTQVELRHRLELGLAFTLETVAYRHDFSRDWFKLNRFADGPALADIIEDPTGARGIYYDILRGEEDSATPGERLRIGTNGRDFVSQGIQTTADWRTKGDGWKNALEVGVRLHYDAIDRLHTEQGFLMQGGDLVRDDTPLQTTTDNYGSATALALHALDQVDIGDFSFSPGVRLEHIITNFYQGGEDFSNTQSVIIPGFGAYWEFIETVGVLAGVNRGFSPVAPGQNEDVEPETSTNYEAGFRHFDPDSGQLAEVVGFFSDYGNLTGQCTFSAGCENEDIDRQFNAGEVNVYGVESVVATAFGLTGEWSIPLRATYTLTMSEFLQGFESDNPQFGEVDVGDELPYVPTHQGSLRLGIQHPDGGVTGAATYVGEMREEASQGDEGRRTDPYVMIDLLGSYRVWRQIEVYAKFENVANAQPIASRRPYGARPLKPFMAALGVRGEF